MGYTTTFTGELSFDKPIDKKTANYLNAFFQTRHVTRNTDAIHKILQKNAIPLEDIMPTTAGIQTVGEQGKFFAVTHECKDFSCFDDSVIDCNEPPSDCPSLWCDFAISPENNTLYPLDGKNYEYVAWLKWLIQYIIAPAGYKLNGKIECEGEDWDDRLLINVTDNHIKTWLFSETADA